jgi:predicted RNase H-like nuclease (RuvC/YqgF family)
MTRVKDLLQRQTSEVDQLKQQINEHHQNNHAEENSKIEIRNLQNALDSSKKELEAQKVLMSDYKKKLDDLNKQLESKPAQKAGGDSFLVIIASLFNNIHSRPNSNGFIFYRSLTRKSTRWPPTIRTLSARRTSCW